MKKGNTKLLRLLLSKLSLSHLKRTSEIVLSIKGGDPTTDSSTVALLRLNPLYQFYLRHLSPLLVDTTTSGKTNLGGLTGGVYKARERIHHSMLICDY